MVFGDNPNNVFRKLFWLLHHLTLQIFNIFFFNVKKVVLCRISCASFCFDWTHSQKSLKSGWSVIIYNILESDASISNSLQRCYLWASGMLQDICNISYWLEIDFNQMLLWIEINLWNTQGIQKVQKRSSEIQ